MTEMPARHPIAPVGARRFAGSKSCPYHQDDDTHDRGEVEMAEAGRHDALLIVVAREDAVEELGDISIGFGRELVSIGKSGVSGAVCHAGCGGAPSFALEAGGMSISVFSGRLVAGSIGDPVPLVIDDGPALSLSSLLLFAGSWSAVSHGNGEPRTMHPGGKPPREDVPLSVLCGRHLCKVTREGVFVRDLATDEGVLVGRDRVLAG